MNNRLCISLSCALLIPASHGPGIASEAPVLSPQQAAAVLADGRPWEARPASGPPARLTLNPGGTGKLDGMMSFPVSWAIRGPSLCLVIGPMGTKCLGFRAVSGGYEGLIEGRRDILLSR
jgi:hypothetical protein